MDHLTNSSIDDGHHDFWFAQAHKHQAASRFGCHDPKPSHIVRTLISWNILTEIHLTLDSTPLHSIVMSGISPPKSSFTSAAISSAVFPLVA